MPGNSWGDDELRSFIARAPRLFWRGDEAEPDRDRFRTEFARVTPGIRKRVLTEVGATTSADGLAFFALQIVEDYESPKRDWLLVSADPWEYLESWIGDAVVKAYRRAAKGRKDRGDLAGIEEASNRRALERGDLE
jgi:hypothetical protein